MIILLLACTGSFKDSQDTGSLEPTLSNVQSTVFTPSCAFSSCHGSGAAGGLDLTDGMSYSELVDVPAAGITGETLVIPADPDNSYLVKKLEGAEGIADDPMPPGAMLEQYRLDRVRDWIAAGANND